ncbi:hypothetical protein J5226_22080 [Lysobacter sp. K5869]|uniref:hypothetical protein n=1 Tax=Lysobacter sp. K5869 TaxID=2820808 RepID=UPI001C061C8C|nr:hypothetical protein [Lysobacter sp. K5869]QWP76245.1 hypothetical protein J5226_22080 [Lysobacter sp. K5869]
MRPLKLASLLLLLLALSFAAQARKPYVEIERKLSAQQLQEVGLSDEQLAKLNRMLREAEDGASRGADATAAADAEDAGPQVGAGAPRERAPGAGQFIGLNDEPIKSRLKHDVAGWEPGTVFELENGQQWKVLKGRMSLKKPMVKPEIVVVPGVAGRWFLQVDEDMPKARVYRID